MVPHTSWRCEKYISINTSIFIMLNLGIDWQDMNWLSGVVFWIGGELLIWLKTLCGKFKMIYINRFRRLCERAICFHSQRYLFRACSAYWFSTDMSGLVWCGCWHVGFQDLRLRMFFEILVPTQSIHKIWNGMDEDTEVAK